MSLEQKEEKFTESSSSSSSSMDEKDLDQNGYVDVQQDLIKSSTEQQQLPEKLNEVDVISQLLSNQFSGESKVGVEEVKVEDILVVQEPDSTTNEEKKVQDEITNLVNKINDQPKVAAELVKPSAKKSSASECSYCVYCKYLFF
jgi:hypothetical protein